MVGALILGLLLVLAVAVGWAIVGPAAMDPALVPSTPFTDGHRIALGFGDGTFGVRTLPLAGGADFRPLLWPVELLSQGIGPDRALVAAFALTPAFNAASGWILGAALGLGPWSRFVLGAALAWNPWVHTTLANGQLEQAVIGGAALMWAATAWGAPGVSGARGLGQAVAAASLTALVTFAVALAAPHVALAGCAGLAALAFADVVGVSVGVPNQTERTPKPRVAIAGRWVLVLLVTAIAALSAARYHAASFDAVVRLFAPFGSTAGEEAPEAAALAPTGESVKREVRLVDLVVPPEPPPRMARGVVHSGHVGIVLLVLGLLGARRAWGGVAVAAGCLALALGDPGPYSLLASLSSTVAESGTPYRFVIGVVVGLAVTGAALPFRWWAALPTVAALWAGAWLGDPRALPLTSVTVTHDPSSELLSDGVGAILDLPISGPNCREGAAHFLLEGTIHGRPLPVVLRPGYDAYATAEGKARARLIDEGLATCSSAAIEAIRGFPTVIAHGHRGCNLGPAETACLRRHFGAGTAKGKVVWWQTGG